MNPSSGAGWSIAAAAVACFLVGCSSSSGSVECDLTKVTFCCCAGDELFDAVCGPHGPECSGGTQYSGSECTDRCGPCQLPCIDAGVFDTHLDVSTDADVEAEADAQLETSSEAMDASDASDTNDADVPASCDAAGACCCDGDVAGPVSCDASGAPMCTPGLTLFFGDDCTRPCGPCYSPCIDTGPG